jgi:hypothetical protein
MEAKNKKSRKSNRNGWHTTTELCVNLKTLLLNDPRMVPGKWYIGKLCRKVESDEYRTDDVFTFKQIRAYTNGKRNQRLYEGKHITLTMSDDGTPRLNFKKLRIDKDFSVERYALGVYNEICIGLEGLVEKG